MFQRNYTIDPESPDRWNADLVVGPPALPIDSDVERSGALARGAPGEVWMAIDAKTIMTEHGKARRNRQRDLNSFQDILHRKNSKTIVGGLLIVNMAPRFQTPLPRRSGGLNEHRNVERTVAEMLALCDQRSPFLPASQRRRSQVGTTTRTTRMAIAARNWLEPMSSSESPKKP